MNTLWAVKALYEGKWVYLTHHISRSKQELINSVMAAARREGFNGTFSERLKQLAWVIVEVEFREKA